MDWLHGGRASRLIFSRDHFRILHKLLNLHYNSGDKFDSPQVKRDIIFNTIDFVQELAYKLPNEL